MNKNILIIFIIMFLVIGGSCYFLNQKKVLSIKGKQLIEENLEVGNIVSVFTDSESENAIRIMICDDAESCQAPRGGKSNFSGIVGIVKGIENNNINLELEDGELKTIAMSEETQIFKNHFNERSRPEPSEGFKK